MKQSTIFFLVIIVLVLGAILMSVTGGSETKMPGKYDTFAQCLKDKDSTFYGAFWCPHCKSQKALFGSSMKFVPYVECSLADASGQTPICISKKIEGYPTWEFADGSRLTGEIPMQTLADKTGCLLPE